MKNSKRKKRSRPSKSKEMSKSKVVDSGEGREEMILATLREAFASSSIEEIASAFSEANGDPDTAAIILSNTTLEDQSTCTTCSSSSGGNCSSSSGNWSGNCIAGSSSSSNGSDAFGDASDFLGKGFSLKSKSSSKGKVIASAGTVSTVLGKEYVRSTPNKVSSKMKGFHEESWSKEDAEQFLCSMLGEESELGLPVVGDVLCQCGYNLDKALNILLELSASSEHQSSDYSGSMDDGDDAQYIIDSNDNLIRTSYSTSRSKSELQQKNVWFTGNPFSSASKASRSIEPNLSPETGSSESGLLPQKVLESLFNMPTPKTAEHEPDNMNWRNVVKQLTSLGQSFDDVESKGAQPLQAKDEYQVLRASAREHWDSMKCYYQKATTAFSNGEREYAAYLSERGRSQNKMAREADEKASQDIFTARNKSIENMITIDLHGQHIKQAMRLFKLHLLFGAVVRSVRLFRVITGCGSHGVGKSKLKTSVIDLLKKEGIEYTEENRGQVLVKLNGQKDFSFLDSISDSE